MIDVFKSLTRGRDLSLNVVFVITSAIRFQLFPKMKQTLSCLNQSLFGLDADSLLYNVHDYPLEGFWAQKGKESLRKQSFC